MLAFGCSIVAGEELEGKQIIPKLFAEHIGEPLINHGLIGAGNDEILLEAFDKVEPGHTVLVGSFIDIFTKILEYAPNIHA